MSTKLKNRLSEKVVNLSDEAVKGSQVQDTGLAAINPDYTALSTNVVEIINENLKNQPLSPQLFDVIKSPSGGTTVFAVPGLNGEEMEKELIGIILDYGTPRAYWDTPDPVEGTAPVCYSRNSLTSYQGKPCSLCPFNEFGSKNDGESQAKACKESIELYLLRPGNIMPVIVRVPASSKRLFQRYMTRLVSNMIPVCGVVTKITLMKATSRGGQPYAKFMFEATDELGFDETKKAKAFGQKFAEILNEVIELEDRAADKAAG